MSATGVEEDPIDLGWLWQQSRPRIRALFKRGGVPPEDAEDILQDILARLLSREYEVRDPVAWLVASAGFAVLAYRRARREQVVQQLDDALAGELVMPAENLDLLCDLDRCLGELSEQCREVIRQRYGMGLEPIELAPEMGFTTRGVRKVTRRCLDRLAARLSKGGYEWPAG